MDKVKVALAVLKKHHFWVMTGTVILLSFVGWFMATSRLWAEYQSGRDKIVKKFGDLTKINSEERENQDWVDGLAKETLELKKKVGLAWEKVYTEQKDHVLIWPNSIGAKNVAVLEKLGPNDPIPLKVRRDYLNYIRSEFPRLLEIADIKNYLLEKQGPADKKPAAKGAAEPPEHEYKVIWTSSNQQKVDERLNWQTTPTWQEVREVQEDLWVYQALLKIINNLNDRATGNYNAKVKEIQSLLIGGDAAAEFQEGVSEGRIDTPAGGGSAGSGSSSGSVGRYVDEKGMPLAAGGAAPAAAADAAPAGGAAPAEFKRMPVVMRLVMDQREVSRLLVECANSPLPVEVRQFRLRSKKGGDMKTGQPAGGAGAGPARGDDKDQSSYDVVVDVKGIIYIFNPPDHAKLGDLPAAGAGGAQPATESPPPNADGGRPEAAATPPAADAGNAPADSGSEPEAAPPRAAGAEPDSAAGPADADKPEGKPDDSPQSN